MGRRSGRAVAEPAVLSRPQCDGVSTAACSRAIPEQSASQRGKVEARLRAVAPCECEKCAADRADEHRSNETLRVPMLAQDVADARAVTIRERAKRLRRDALVRVRYDDGQVVFD